VILAMATPLKFETAEPQECGFRASLCCRFFGLTGASIWRISASLTAATRA